MKTFFASSKGREGIGATLSALIHLDPYMFEDIAEQQIGDDDNNQQSAEEILAVLLARLPDDKLTGFALRLVLTSHASIPREGEFDFLAEAEAAFVPPPPKKSSKTKKVKAAAPAKEAKKPVASAAPQKRRKAAWHERCGTAAMQSRVVFLSAPVLPPRTLRLLRRHPYVLPPDGLEVLLYETAAGLAFLLDATSWGNCNA